MAEPQPSALAQRVQPRLADCLACAASGRTLIATPCFCRAQPHPNLITLTRFTHNTRQINVAPCMMAAHLARFTPLSPQRLCRNPSISPCSPSLELRPGFNVTPSRMRLAVRSLAERLGTRHRLRWDAALGPAAHETCCRRRRCHGGAGGQTAFSSRATAEDRSQQHARSASPLAAPAPVSWRAPLFVCRCVWALRAAPGVTGVPLAAARGQPSGQP